MTRLGLRQSGTRIGRCCGVPVTVPAESGETYCITTEQGTDLTRDHFPDADLVCPKCERTWPASCSHESITLTTPSNPSITGHERSMTALCDDCDAELTVDIEVVDARSRE